MTGLYLKLLLTTFFWGGTFVAARYAVREAPPFYAAACRFAIASAFLFAAMWWNARREGRPLPVPRSARDVLSLGVLGVTGIFLYNAFFFTGLKYTGAANGSLIVAVNPLTTSLIAAWWLGERVRRLQLAGLAVSLAGVVTIVTRGELSVLRSLAFNRGDLLLLGAPLAWALYSVLGRKALDRFSPLVATAYAALSGTLLLVPAAWIESRLVPGSHSFSVYGWAAILQLALLGTVVGFVWWYEAVGRIGASRAALFVNLVPLFGTLQAAVVLGERLGRAQWLGGLLVVAGVAVGTIAARSPADPGAGSMR